LLSNRSDFLGAQMRGPHKSIGAVKSHSTALAKFQICYRIYCISHSPVETFRWLCVYMVVKLHAHWHQHLLNVKFSYMEHCWWLTLQTCVNILIN